MDRSRKKVVIRRLPPLLHEEAFTESMKEFDPKLKSCNYVQGKVASSDAKQDVHSRAYLVFTYIDSMLEFCKAFNGHSFADSSDILYNAVVEFAPYQGSHEEQKQKVDSTENTIDIDPEYMQYLEDLKTPLKEVDYDSEDIEYKMSKASEKTKITPLIEALRREKEAATEKNKKVKRKKDQKKLDIRILMKDDFGLIKAKQNGDLIQTKEVKKKQKAKKVPAELQQNHAVAQTLQTEPRVVGKKKFVLRKKNGEEKAFGS